MNAADFVGWVAGLLTGKQPLWPELAPLHVNHDGWLEGEQIARIPTHPSWYYPHLSTPSGDPLAIVCHASATPVGTAKVMANNRARPRTLQDRTASWHISVEPNLITQMAPLSVGCWHAIGNIKGIGPANRTSIGIELVGFEKGPWPEAQVWQAMRVWRAIVQSYGIKRSVAMVPHAVIDPARRSDPGADWMKNHAERVLDFAYAP